MLAAVIALLIAVFFYGVKSKKYLLILLRALGLFFIALLVINPSFNKKTYHLLKPNLVVFADNSKSINYLGQKKSVQAFLDKLKLNKAINTKYDVAYYQFDNDINTLADSLSFDGKQTQIQKVLDFINTAYTKNTKTILLTDGNQTQGNSYSNTKLTVPVIPVVLGDTTQYPDLEITTLNTNKYSYIKNKFPVEVFASYSGDKEVQTVLKLMHKGQVIASKTIRFTKTKQVNKVNFLVKATQKGLQHYSVKIATLANEKNTNNNSKSFTIDVIDNKRKILLISAINHPDIAMLKRSIQANEQLEITIKKPSDKIVWKKYQLAILYQPTSQFKKVFETLTKTKKNYLLITGTHSDWRFINKNQSYFSKKPTTLKETVFPEKTVGFDAFQFKNIAFSEFSPLQTQFGEVAISAMQKTVLHAKINGVSTNYPILALVEDNGLKRAIWDGEGFWKWRLAHFKANQSFTNFDTFIINLAQYLSSNEAIDRLTIAYDKSHYQNDKIQISANFVDENYTFDASKTLTLKLTNQQTKKVLNYQFLVADNQYKINIDGLPKGNYNFTVSVLGTKFKKHGSLSVLAYDIEKQFITANYNALKQVAQTNNTSIYLMANANDLITKLTNDSTKPIQEEIVAKIPLIDWRWLLPLILLLFTVEWFIRKYTGLV